MKIDAITYGSHNPYEENHRVSRLRENLTSGSEGEGLETDNLVPRQSFTRQNGLKDLVYRYFLDEMYGRSDSQKVEFAFHCVMVERLTYEVIVHPFGAMESAERRHPAISTP